MVEGSLAESLSRGGDEEAIKKLCALLLAVDRLSTVEGLYCNARVAAVQAAWDELASSAPTSSDALSSWLPRFISWLVSFFEQVRGQGEEWGGGQRHAADKFLSAVDLLPQFRNFSIASSAGIWVVLEGASTSAASACRGACQGGSNKGLAGNP